MKSTLAVVHNGLAWLTLLGCLLQFYMVGITIFGVGAIAQHGNTGRGLIIVAAVMVIVSLIIRTSRRTTWYSVAVLLLLFPVQGIFVYLEMPGVLKSVHALTGVLILWLSYSLAAGSARAVAARKPVEAPASAG